MMTIKIIRRDSSEHETTYLFEANQPVWYFDAVSSYSDWCNMVKKVTDGYSISCTYLMEDAKESDFHDNMAFQFAYVFFYTPEDIPKVLLIRRARIYIMQEGKTIDSIIV